MPDITELDPRLRDNVRLLGDLLGEVILEDRGPAFFDTIERIRALAKAWRAGDADALTQMQEIVSRLREPELVHLARAFHQFLNLSNIAEQFHRIRVSAPPRESIERTLATLDSGAQAERLISEIDIELVLTAHPTEVMRRTLIQKYDAVASTLAKLEREPDKRDAHSLALKRVIAEAWHTDEIRHERPSPQ
ncbi:MAG: phosphoenolpyruvate carboxylase, partial [Pseudomonadales bacterium]